MRLRLGTDWRDNLREKEQFLSNIFHDFHRRFVDGKFYDSFIADSFRNISRFEGK